MSGILCSDGLHDESYWLRVPAADQETCTEQDLEGAELLTAVFVRLAGNPCGAPALHKNG